MKTNRIFKVLWLLFLLNHFSFSDILFAQTTQDIIDDMTLPPDAALHGTEGMSWGSGIAVIDAGGQCPRQNYKGQYFHAITQWGQFYIDRKGSPATNVRVQVRNIVTKVLQKDGTWVIVQQGQADGAAFVENFAGNAATGADWRDESKNEGGRSATVGIKNYAGHNLHFWPTGPRASIDTSKVVGAFSSYEARLIVDDPKLPDDRALCRTTGQNGSDWWLGLNMGWLPDWSANSGCAGGRAKFITSNWQTFNMCNLPPEWIKANPPVGTRPTLVSVSSVSISPSMVSIIVGLSILCKGTVFPLNSTNQAVTWSSSNTAVASVNLTGNIYAASPGTAVISAISVDGNKVGSVNLVVVDGFPLPARIEAEEYAKMSGVNTETCLEGGTDVAGNDAGDWIDYRVSPAAGLYTLDLRISSPKSTCQIQVMSGSTVLTTVKVPNTGGWQNWSTTTSTSFNLPAGSQTIRLNVISGEFNLNWIEFKKNGVNIPVTVVTINLNSIKITTGSTTQLTATIAPSNASNKTVSWSSSNTGIATVSSTGLVTGVSVGSATITVTTQDGNKTATSTGEIATEVKPIESYLQLKVYPNPVKDDVLNIRVDGQTENASLNIFTIDGSKKYSGILMKGETKLINNLATGTYLIKVSGNNLNEVRKIVIK